MRTELSLFILILILTCGGVQAEYQSPSSLLPGMNLSIAPGEDFYQFANGNEIASTSLPPDMNRFYVKERLEKRNTALIHAIIENCSQGGYPADSDEGKLGEYYLQGMDTEKRNMQGVTPVKPLLDRIDRASNSEELLQVSTLLMMQGIPTVFQYNAAVDPTDARKYIGTITQGGLGLSRGYYLSIPSFIPVQTEYKRHIQRTFELAGASEEEAHNAAETVMRIETALATSSQTGVENRNVSSSRYQYTEEELAASAPGINWSSFFRTAETPGIQTVRLRQPGYIWSLSSLLQDIPVSDWRYYFKWKVLDYSSPYLSEPFAREAFSFHDQYLSGIQEEKPRWEEVTEREDQDLGWLIAPLYLKDTYNDTTATSIADLTRSLIAAYHDRIEQVSWMDLATKTAAHKKLDLMQVHIGYPHPLLNYSGVHVQNDSYIGNILRAGEFAYRNGSSGISLIGRPADQEIWMITPQTADAYYNQAKNEIIIPAGILQPPVYYPEGDDALNYGAIGSILGHEMTHGFDDAGRQYGERGESDDWWTEKDADQFKNLSTRIAQTYSTISILPGLHLNGNLTLGENIADLGGIAIASDAYRQRISDPDEKVDGFSRLQWFFISYARVWSGSVRERELVNWVMTDPHTPYAYRVNETVYHTDSFYQAYPDMNRTEPKHLSIW